MVLSFSDESDLIRQSTLQRWDYTSSGHLMGVVDLWDEVKRHGDLPCSIIVEPEGMANAGPSPALTP
jgi:hypothetical protein